MTPKLIVKELQDIDAKIIALNRERECKIKSYIELNREFANGELVWVVGDVKGFLTTSNAYVNGASIHEGNGEIYYHLRAVKNDGTMSLQRYNRTIYDNGFTIKKPTTL